MLVPSRSTTPVKPTVDDSAVREQLTYCFGEWVRLYQHSFSVEKSFVDFVVQLQNQGILKGEEISSLFFRVCAEVSVDSYIKHKAAGGTPATGIFQPVDAFAKLIVFMIKYHADPTGANNDKAKVHYMTKVLSIVVLVLAQSHEELGPHFQQKPFFRFFSSLLSNLHAIETHLGSAYYQILVALRFVFSLHCFMIFETDIIRHKTATQSTPFSRCSSLALPSPGLDSFLIASSCPSF